MSLTEQKNKRKSDLESMFSDRFEQVSISDTLCFRTPNGGIFRVCSFPEEGALVIEYAETEAEANLNQFEDGDRFYLDEMSLESMFQAMLQEIAL